MKIFERAAVGGGVGHCVFRLAWHCRGCAYSHRYHHAHTHTIGKVRIISNM